MWVSWFYSFFGNILSKLNTCMINDRLTLWNPSVEIHQEGMYETRQEIINDHRKKKLPTCVAELLVHQRQRWTHESKARIFRISFWTFWRKCCWESCTRPGKLQGGPRADCYKWSYGAPVNGRKNHGFHWCYFTSITIYNSITLDFQIPLQVRCLRYVLGGFQISNLSFGVIRMSSGWMCFFFRSSPWNPTYRAMKLNIWPPSKPVWGRLVVEFPSYPKQNLGTFGYLQAVLLVNFAGLLVFSYSWYRVL